MADQVKTPENESGFVLLKTAHGVEVPIRYGLSGIRRLCKHFECKLAQLGDKINEAMNADQLDTMEVLVKIGAENEAALTGTALSLTPDQLLSALDAPGAIDSLMGAFNGAFGTMNGSVSEPDGTPKTVGKIRPSQKDGPTNGGK